MEKKIAFTLLLFLPFLFFLFSKEIYWLYHLLILFIILFKKNKSNIKKLKNNKPQLFLLLVPLFWAFFFSFADQQYAIVQALFYLITPFLLTFLGVKLSRFTNQKLVFQYIVYSGTIGAIFYVGISLYFFGLKSFIDPYSLREFFFWVSISSVMSIFLALYSEKFGFVLIKNRMFKYFIIGINSLALYFTASRTYYFIFVIFLIIFVFYDNKKKLFLFLGLFALFFAFLPRLPNDNQLVKKLLTSATEISVRNYQTDEEINANYRGYETNMGLETYMSGTELNFIFGHGFEKKVDLKTEVNLGGFSGSAIPVLHNGYVYILLRIGLLGLIFYFIFFVKLFKLRLIATDFKFFNIVITCAIASLLFSNFVIGTFFSMEMSMVWVLFGIYIGIVEMQNKRNKTFEL